jgi:hypothetical protein
MERWEEQEHADYLRAGTIAAAALNPHIDHKRQKPLTPYDFFNIPRPPEPPPTFEQRKQRAAAFFDAHNRRVAKLERSKRSA